MERWSQIEERSDLRFEDVTTLCAKPEAEKQSTAFGLLVNKDMTKILITDLYHRRIYWQVMKR